jgi:hypothetical protein
LIEAQTCLDLFLGQVGKCFGRHSGIPPVAVHAVFLVAVFYVSAFCFAHLVVALAVIAYFALVSGCVFDLIRSSKRKKMLSELAPDGST